MTNEEDFPQTKPSTRTALVAENGTDRMAAIDRVTSLNVKNTKERSLASHVIPSRTQRLRGTTQATG